MPPGSFFVVLQTLVDLVKHGIRYTLNTHNPRKTKCLQRFFIHPY